ncbi:MAG: A/G-specific adenine glycosylase, partial [Fidelibacterota bacterium]
MTGFSNALLKWYSDQEIEMPWRNETDPYRIWLSEVMLQQTQIQTVKPYYIRWINSLPTVKDTAGASEDQVLKLWEGLGYYARARNFRHACQMVFEKFEGEIPSDPDQFRQLKGVGDYITAAVQSIVFGHPIPVIDGNVRRLTSRLLELSLPPSKHQKEILEFLELHIGDTCPGDFNQAMMDLAREVCKPKKPLCNQCPVSHFCT